MVKGREKLRGETGVFVKKVEGTGCQKMGGMREREGGPQVQLARTTFVDKRVARQI